MKRVLWGIVSRLADLFGIPRNNRDRNNINYVREENNWEYTPIANNSQ